MSLTRLLTIALVVLVPSIASADDKATCLASYSSAQDLRTASKLVEASKELRVCARSVCPAFVARDCTRWIDEVDAATPTVVFSATLDGRDVTDVSVTVDGVVFADQLDGAAVPLDPGPHDITFGRAGLEPLRQQVLARTGEKNRAVSVAFVTPTVKPPEPVRETPPPPPIVVVPPTRDEIVGSPWRPIGIVVAGTGVGLLVAGGVAGIAAVVTKSDHCIGSTCDPGTVGTLHDQTTVSTVTLISGVILAAAGVTIAILAKPRHQTVSASLGSFAVRF